MKGLLGRLFGTSQRDSAPAARPAVEYNGHRITPAPFSAEGQYQTAGTIEKDFPDGVRKHDFIRVDKHATEDDAAEFSVMKAKQMIDQMGDRIYQMR